jgi:hypothetical protein
MATTTGNTRCIVVVKKRAKPTDNGSTIAVPPLEIHCTLTEDFESKPLWRVTAKEGLGFWPLNAKGAWKKEERRDQPRLSGEFDELDSLEPIEAGDHYVLVKSDKEEVWINVGALQAVQGSGYQLKYQYATQIRTRQYGIRGVAQARFQGQTRDFKLMAVRAKTRREGPRTGPRRIGTQSDPYTLVQPGIYQGVLHPRGKYVAEHGDEALIHSLSIYLWRQWEDGKWVEGIKKATGRSTNVFIHPAHFPDWLDGCLALGYTSSDYGFTSAEDSRKAMRAVFELLNIRTRDDFKKQQHLPWNKKQKVFVTVTDRRPGSADIVTLRVRLPIDPKDAANANDRFRLYSVDGSAYDRTQTVKNDAQPADNFLDLVFGGVDRRLSYSLAVDRGSDGDSYFIFEAISYSQILTLNESM